MQANESLQPYHLRGLGSSSRTPSPQNELVDPGQIGPDPKVPIIS